MKINGLMQSNVANNSYQGTKEMNVSISSEQTKVNIPAATVEISDDGLKKAQDNQKENQSPIEKSSIEDVFHGTSTKISGELSELLGGGTNTALGPRPADSNAFPIGFNPYSNYQYHSLEELKNKSGFGYVVHGDSFESILKDYEVRRADIEKKCGHDEELMAAHLEQLNFGLRHRFSSLAFRLGKQIEYTRQNGSSLEEFQKLATHKDFNFKKFQQNAYDMMDEFAQAIVNFFDKGYNAADAFKSSIELMSNKYVKTSSVNELSFSDYMILQEYSLLEKRTQETSE